jgi:hypothetical protein
VGGKMSGISDPDYMQTGGDRKGLPFHILERKAHQK